MQQQQYPQQYQQQMRGGPAYQQQQQPFGPSQQQYSQYGRQQQYPQAGPSAGHESMRKRDKLKMWKNQRLAKSPALQSFMARQDVQVLRADFWNTFDLAYDAFENLISSPTLGLVSTRRERGERGGKIGRLLSGGGLGGGFKLSFSPKNILRNPSVKAVFESSKILFNDTLDIFSHLLNESKMPINPRYASRLARMRAGERMEEGEFEEEEEEEIPRGRGMRGARMQPQPQPQQQYMGGQPQARAAHVAQPGQYFHHHLHSDTEPIHPPLVSDMSPEEAAAYKELYARQEIGRSQQGIQGSQQQGSVPQQQPYSVSSPSEYQYAGPQQQYLGKQGTPSSQSSQPLI